MHGQHCDDRQILKVSGADAHTFLQGMVTNDVAKLADGLVYAGLLTPQGKYLADFFLVPDQDAILLDVKADMAAGLAQRLSMYKLRADVTIAAIDMPVWRGLGDGPSGAMPDPRDPNLGWRHYVRACDPADFTPTNIDFDALRVAHCVPESNVELIPNDSYILESGFETLNGVDFKKGCYVGQEVTARMKHKTELRKGLRRVSIDGSAPVGTEIISGGKAAGTLFTQSGGNAIAYLRLDRIKGDATAGTARITI